MTRVWYHAGCADGFGAAWALWAALGDGATYCPVRYGEDPPEWRPGDVVWIVDFSYPRSVLERLAAEVDLTVIDHHETAEQDLADLPFAHFDASRSGAVATWEHVHEGVPVPELLLYVQDRDLWEWRLPGSRAVSYGLVHSEWSFPVWSALDVQELRADGERMVRVVDAIVALTAALAVPCVLAGHHALAVNSSCLLSELGHALAANSESGIGAVWFYDGRSYRWELRSLKGGPNVGAIAKSLGGGGHRHAAGFRSDLMSIGVPPNQARDLAGKLTEWAERVEASPGAPGETITGRDDEEAADG